MFDDHIIFPDYEHGNIHIQAVDATSYRMSYKALLPQTELWIARSPRIKSDPGSMEAKKGPLFSLETLIFAGFV